MKTLFAVLLVALSGYSHGAECDHSLTERLTKLIDSGLMTVEQNTTDKHEKLTHHDYPISCTASYAGSDYLIFTGSVKKCMVIKRLEGQDSAYFGVFCS